MSGGARAIAPALPALLVVILVIGSVALADGAARVIIVGAPDQDPVVARLRRELALLHLDAERAAEPGGGRRDLAALAREHHAAAAVAVETSPIALVIWTDPALRAGEAAPPEVRVDAALAGSAEPRMLVIRAVEILRERLLPAPPPPEAPSDLVDAGVAEDAAPVAEDAAPVADAGVSAVPDAAPPMEIAADAGPPVDAGAIEPAPPPRDLSLFVGPALLASPGGLGATPHVWLGARWSPLRRLDLDLVAFLPTTAAGVSAPEGSAELRAGALGAGASARLTAPESSFFAAAGGGIGGMLIAFDGHAKPPWKAEHGLRATMLPYARAAAGYWLTPHLGLRADVVVGLALPEPVLWIAGQRAATFGEPAALLAAGIEVRP